MLYNCVIKRGTSEEGMWKHIGKKMFGLSLGIIGIIVFILIAGYISFMLESSIGSGIIFIGLMSYLFFFNGVSLSMIGLYSAIYIFVGVVWATFRLIRGARADYEKNLKDNTLYKEEGETKKETLGKVLDKVSFSLFGYRVFFMPVDIIDYIISDFLKELFEVIKKRVRRYLFKSILGEVE